MAECLIRVRLRPAAGGDEIAGERDGVVQVRVSAPPHDGRANEALRRLIARRARVGVQRVSIVRGERTRDKLVRVDGVEEGQLRAALGLGSPPPAASG